MQSEVEEVLLLQSDWSAQNTGEMKRRGEIVRREIPAALAPLLDGLRLMSEIDDLAIEGRDGTGLKTEIPWVRVYSKNRSASATQGWYVVFLFSALGDRMYLSLNQGTTRWEGGEFKARPKHELLSRADWARRKLSYADTRAVTAMALQSRRSGLGPQYELGNVVAFGYEIDSIPGDEALAADLATMVKWLALIHEAEEQDFNVPGEPPAEIADVLTSLRQATGAARNNGQGFRLDSAEKLAIERHAMRVATEHFESDGYEVEDVGATQPYDLDVRKGNERLSVEVKGTTSPGAQVILTQGEVVHHRDRFPHNALVVVHSIHLDRSGASPMTSDGELHVVMPWSIRDDDLNPIAFKYSTGLSS